jgi:hypothetical protein
MRFGVESVNMGHELPIEHDIFENFKFKDFENSEKI